MVFMSSLSKDKKSTQFLKVYIFFYPASRVASIFSRKIEGDSVRRVIFFDNDNMKTSFISIIDFCFRKCISKSIPIRFKPDRDNLI